MVAKGHVGPCRLRHSREYALRVGVLHAKSDVQCSGKASSDRKTKGQQNKQVFDESKPATTEDEQIGALCLNNKEATAYLPC